MNQNKHSWVIPTIIVLGLVELFIDTQTPLGTADYIFYFIPVALSAVQRRSNVPVVTAFFSCILILVGYFLSPTSSLVNVAVINRSFAAVTIWIVAIMVKVIIDSRNQVGENDWVRTGHNDAACALRGELTSSQIGQKLLEFLSDYSEVKAGAIYVWNESKKVLEYSTGHAYLPKPENYSYQLGQGLLGQCAKDLKPKELTHLNSHYLKISSGLGSQDPQGILIYPLVADGKLIGTLEVALSLEHLRLNKLLLEQICESVAIAIRSSQNRETLTQLLKQAQTLAEELQTQQEELRVTNEELEQQSKALKESQQRLENQQAELEQNNQQLGEQAQFLEHQKLQVDEKNRALQISHLSLEEKTNEVERASKYKSEFLANMSHELRTPLNSTLILAKLLSDNKPGTLTEEQRKYADIIYSSGNDLLYLINDILDLSKVEAGKMDMNPEVVEIDSLKRNLDSVFRAQAFIKKLEFKIEVDPRLPLNFITDRQRLEQILKNFLSNAFKFTEKGFVQLRIYPDPKGIAFAISDSGIGIPQEQQEIIFEAFRQADGTSNRKFGGTGLGLSISKELSHLLGGKISVKSAIGQGSTFILNLPLELKAPHKDEIAVPIKVHYASNLDPNKTEEVPAALVEFSFKDDRDNLTPNARKILIIEDEEAFAKILFDLAHEMNFLALVSPTAEGGLKLANLYHPNAVLLDMRLPDHNGLLVLDQLKMNPKTRHIPVHVISSSDFSRSAMEMGAIGYMNKPVKREQLQEAFTHLTSLMSQSQKHILVVEDDDVQRAHITNLISDDFVQVDAVNTAGDALNKLASKTYDCMIMDLSLPDLSGYELLAKLSNENQNYSYPPVIVYTARDLTAPEEEKLRQYSGSIIIKGAKSPERLLSEVTLFLHRVETELPPERQKMLKELRNREKTLEDRLILVVDDDVRNIFALTGALESYGARVIVARNGREAIEKINTTPDLDLVLMDIMMPEMDGYEAMRKLRMNKKFDKLPIIALTAKAMRDDQEKCLEAGANDYLPKPINLDKLLSLIRVWLPNQRSFLSK